MLRIARRKQRVIEIRDAVDEAGSFIARRLSEASGDGCLYRPGTDGSSVEGSRCDVAKFQLST
ncbi:hypothetical protein [Caballeronia sp. Lep1P3]|uniref:hypothetical protein n=1 Tax=Caballeronia sp. Lep1P3 TaxID=2878150 RepID=UPI001FD23FAF|nr:hypothetical protein [Caballeronia sp. Lep1P3]